MMKIWSASLMSNDFDDFVQGLFEGDFKHEFVKGATRARIKKLVSGAPEVMVKISGNATSAKGISSHLSYISRKGDVELETETGEVISSRDGVRSLMAEWREDSISNRKTVRHTTNIILSMPNGTDAIVLKNAVRDFAKRQFGGNHQYVMALHEDTDQPHIHLTVKNFGMDGKRLHVKNGDPQRWREAFSHSLEQHGIEAEATPRAVRGVVKKGVRQALKHIRDRDNAKVDDAQIAEIIAEIAKEKEQGVSNPKPWDEHIKGRQSNIRKAWIMTAQALAASESTTDKKLARDILGFVSGMPQMKTQRDELKEKVIVHLSKELESER